MRQLLREGADEQCAVGGVTPLQLAHSSADTLALMKQAVLPWAPHRSALYPPRTNTRALFLLLVYHRLSARLPTPALGNKRTKRHSSPPGNTLPALPRELWLEILAFALQRAAECDFPTVVSCCAIGAASHAQLSVFAH